MRGGHNDGLMELWTHLRTLPRIDPLRCWQPQPRCKDQSRTDAAWRMTPHLAVPMISIGDWSAQRAEFEGRYGHLWRAIQLFFQCAVLESLQFNDSGVPMQRTVFIPARHAWPQTGENHSAFTLLRKLFDGQGSRMELVRSWHVPSCPPPWDQRSGDGVRGACCTYDAAAVQERIRQEHDVKSVRMANLIASEKPSKNGIYARAMRRIVWANLGVDTGVVADTALFVSNAGASNLRTITNEPEVAKALEQFFDSARPRVRFRYIGLESLTTKAEIRLLRRTRVYISLFGASLHNVQFLAEGALVVHIHTSLGNLKRTPQSLHGDAAFYLERYGTSLGLSWVDYAPEGWSESGLESSVEPNELVEVVANAWAGNLSRLALLYRASVDREVVRACANVRPGLCKLGRWRYLVPYG